MNPGTARKTLSGAVACGVNQIWWMIDSLDRDAKRLRMPRQSAIKAWIAERLQGRAA
jgi:hypothetical protein